MFDKLFIPFVWGMPLLGIGLGFLVWGWAGALLGYAFGQALTAVVRGYFNTAAALKKTSYRAATSWISGASYYLIMGGGIFGWLAGDPLGLGGVLGALIGAIGCWLLFNFSAYSGIKLHKN